MLLPSKRHFLFPGDTRVGLLVVFPFLFSALMLIEVGCQQKSTPPKLFSGYRDISAITGPSVVDPSEIAMDVYVDATVSMSGYANAGNATVFDHFVEDLEALITTCWKKSSPQWFKFGDNVRQISRAEFLNARESGFYNDADMKLRTSIEKVISRTDPLRVSIVVTDLFQHEGDANAVVTQIKETCFAGGVQMGVAAIRADFSGMIYDSKVPPYRYSTKEGAIETYRPFYVLVFGEESRIRRVFEALSTLKYARSE